MLPFWGMRREGAARAVYFHHTAAEALNDFIDNLTNGETVWEKAVGDYAMQLYTAAAAGKRIFLDKTPHYFLMVPMLRRVLPDASIIVLLRNPLAVLMSICTTFNRGRFMWHEYWIDWFEGHRCLAQAVREAGGRQVVVHYEDLVASPEDTLQRLCGDVGIEFLASMVSDYKAVALAGRMGDPTGVHRYAAVSTDSIDKWQKFFDTTYRRRIAERMLRLLDPNDLETLGYPLQQLLDQLNSTPPRAGIDLRSRLHRAIDSVFSSVDFRYLQARWRARQNGVSHAYGYFRRNS